MQVDDTMKWLMDRAEAEEAEEKQKLLDKIKLTQDRLSVKEKAMKEMQYEYDLIFGDLYHTINYDLKNSCFNIFRYLNSDMLWKAWRWSSHRDTLDKELADGDLTEKEYKESKNDFDYTTKTVKEKFFGELKDKVKFKEIIMFWTAGYEFVYTYKKQEIIIFVPIFHADDKDYYYALNGYTASYKEGQYCNSYIFGNLDYKKVAEKLQDWMINEGWKKGENDGKANSSC